VTRLLVEQSGIRFSGGVRIYFIVQNVNTDSGVQPFPNSVDIMGFSFGIKRPACDVDHSPSAEFMNKWSHTSTPIYTFLAGAETTSSLPQKLTFNLPDLRSSPAPGSCRIFQNDTESAETNAGTQKLTQTKTLQVYCIMTYLAI